MDFSKHSGGPPKAVHTFSQYSVPDEETASIPESSITAPEDSSSKAKPRKSLREAEIIARRKLPDLWRLMDTDDDFSAAKPTTIANVLGVPHNTVATGDNIASTLLGLRGIFKKSRLSLGFTRPRAGSTIPSRRKGLLQIMLWRLFYGCHDYKSFGPPSTRSNEEAR